ncbi:hypothetical protein AVEN_52293-1, partial [Araneus ventricosus]
MARWQMKQMTRHRHISIQLQKEDIRRFQRASRVHGESDEVWYRTRALPRPKPTLPS